MNCNELRENLFELATEEKLSAESGAHLAQCPACAGELESMRKTMALMDAWEAPEPSPYYDSRLRARLREVQEQEASKRAGILAWLRRPALAGSLAALLIVGGIMLRPTGSGDVVPRQHDHIAATQEGTAVDDLEALDHEEYADLELLDVIAAEDGEVNQ